MWAEIIADILTFFVFLLLIVYVWRQRFAPHLFTPLFVFVIGIFVISISDAISLTTNNPLVECWAGKFIAAGALVSIASLFHAFTVFPARSRLYKLIPTVYIISGALIFHLFFTPYLLYCHPALGGRRGILWDTFLLWTYSLLLINAILPGIRYFTLKIKVQKIQELLIFIGTILAVIYVGISEVIPHFSGQNYKTSIFALPIMGAFYIYSSVKYGTFIKAPEPEEMQRDKVNIEIRNEKIVAIANTHAAFKVFRNLVSEKPGMIISIKPPNYIRENYNIEKTPILWITYFPKSYIPNITPGRLHFEGMEAVINFARKGGKIVLFEGIEYMITNFGRRFLTEFIESLRSIDPHIKVILAIKNVDIVEGFADKTYTVEIAIDHPKVILTKTAPTCKSSVIITSREIPCISDSKIIKLTDDFNVDKLIFEGMRYFENYKLKSIYIDCMDYIISVAGEKNAVNFLKDIIDLTVIEGGSIYIRYTPLMTEFPILISFVDAIQ